MLSQDSTDETNSHQSGETWSGSWLLEQLPSRLKQVGVLICVHLYFTIQIALVKGMLPLLQSQNQCSD